MWWKDDKDEWVSEHVTRLLGAWREGDLRFVTVIGSTWTGEGDRTLFVGVDPDLDPRPRAWVPGSNPVDRRVRYLIRRFGPLPYPTEWVPYGFAADDREAHRILPRPGALGAIRLLLAIHSRLVRLSPFELVMVPVDAADELTRSELLGRFDVPSRTQIGYVGPIRLASGKGKAVHRHRSGGRATVGCGVETAGGAFLTTAGHLGATEGEIVYQNKRRALIARNAPWGRIAAVTSPTHPAAASAAAAGLDLAAIETDGTVPVGDWQPVDIGDPSLMRRREYVSWMGAETGFHEADLMITAAGANAMGSDVPYEHALMVTGRPPALAGRDGDSGSAVYDRDGRLLGHFVGTEGGRTRGTAPNGWFQMIDIAHDFLERQCGPVHTYYGDRGSRGG